MPPGAPALTGDTALDGYQWINFRRQQIGLSSLVRDSRIDAAALGHSNYLRLNNTVTHDQVAGQPGFTGVRHTDRLRAAGYPLTGGVSGEVISAANDNSGFFHAEGLISAIYHRFVLFEPVFRDIGVGAASGNGYTYFTADFAAPAGYGAVLGRANLALYPFQGQTVVPVNFFSDSEAPDPVPDRDEVGYPVSVHADLDANVTVQSFTLRQRGGADVPVRLLARPADPHVPASGAAIVPLSVLKSNTVYDASFNGSVGGATVTRSWSFTTR